MEQISSLHLMGRQAKRHDRQVTSDVFGAADRCQTRGSCRGLKTCFWGPFRGTILCDLQRTSCIRHDFWDHLFWQDCYLLLRWSPYSVTARYLSQLGLTSPTSLCIAMEIRKSQAIYFNAWQSQIRTSLGLNSML